MIPCTGENKYLGYVHELLLDAITVTTLSYDTTVGHRQLVMQVCLRLSYMLHLQVSLTTNTDGRR